MPCAMLWTTCQYAFVYRDIRETHLDIAIWVQWNVRIDYIYFLRNLNDVDIKEKSKNILFDFIEYHVESIILWNF